MFSNLFIRSLLDFITSWSTLVFTTTVEKLVRVMCGAKLVEKKRTEDLMEMLGLKKTVVQMAKANGVRWYGHVFRRDDGHVLRKALEFEVKGKRK